jgi:hypothetical protein
VTYLAGDVLDARSWDRLRGQRFNVIFSDAFHTGRALLNEYDEMLRTAILDPEEFVVVWDDLDNRGMRRAFRRIAADLVSRYGLSEKAASIEFLRGWLGTNERAHAVGVVCNLRREVSTLPPRTERS